MNKEDFINDLIGLANQIDVKIEQEEAEKFYNYMNLLLEWNNKINLTAIVEPKEIILKHFIDSITINNTIKESTDILDIGTGAGFPGIPLKMINPNKKFTLVDSLNKRIIFLNEVCDSLKLKSIQCLHGRAEELAMNKLYRQKYDAVTSRAVARLAILLEYMLPFVKVGGKCICMKGPNVEEELKEASKAIELLGGKLDRVENIVLPNSDIERNIVIVQKIKDTPDKYPRKAGVPAKQPII